jgi:hypothetical protein
MGTGEFARLLYAAIRALPHAKDSESCEELKCTLCDLLFNIDLLFVPPPEFRR